MEQSDLIAVCSAILAAGSNEAFHADPVKQAINLVFEAQMTGKRLELAFLEQTCVSVRADYHNSKLPAAPEHVNTVAHRERMLREMTPGSVTVPAALMQDMKKLQIDYNDLLAAFSELKARSSVPPDYPACAITMDSGRVVASTTDAKTCEELPARVIDGRTQEQIQPTSPCGPVTPVKKTRKPRAATGAETTGPEGSPSLFPETPPAAQEAPILPSEKQAMVAELVADAVKSVPAPLAGPDDQVVAEFREMINGWLDANVVKHFEKITKKTWAQETQEFMRNSIARQMAGYVA